MGMLIQHLAIFTKVMNYTSIKKSNLFTMGNSFQQFLKYFKLFYEIISY